MYKALRSFVSVTSPMLRYLGMDRRGATAVEFGIVAFPFFMTLFGIFEIGYSFYLSTALDAATHAGARAVMTGAVSTSGLTAAQFKTQIICPALSSVISCNNVFINMTVVPQTQSPTGYYSYVNSAQSGLIQPALNSTSTTFCPGAAGQYIVLQLLYPVPFFTAFISAATTTTYGGKKIHVLMSTATFKSEPYAGAQAYAGC